MQKKALFFTIMIMAWTAFPLSAQSKKEAKWSESLLALEKSDFTVQYTAIKDSIEQQIADFHRKKAELSPEEIADVRKGYELSVAEFEKILVHIRDGFTDPKKRALITQNADYFSKMLESDLNGALNYYNTTCKERIDSYIDQSQGAIGLMEIGILITLGKELWSLWDQKQKRAAEMSAKYFEDHFMSNHRFKKWEHY